MENETKDFTAEATNLGADQDLVKLYNAGIFNKDTPTEPKVGDFADFTAPTAGSNALDDYYKNFDTSEVDDNKIYSGVLNKFQDEINATKQSYGQLLNQVKQQGQGRLGEDVAMQSRRGLMGSDFGASQTQGVRGLNLTEEEKVRAAEAAALAAIKSQALGLAQNEIANKRQAKSQGTTNYLNYLSGAEERRTAKLENLANALLLQNVDPLNLDPKELDEIAKGYGVTTNDIINSYLGRKSTQEAEQAANQAQMVKDNSFNLSEGQARYQYNPETGQVEQVASRGKTYAPSSGGGSSTGSVSGVSKQAQDIIDIMNVQGGSIDDYVKGTSNAAQKLRSEVFAGISAQGGNTEKNRGLLTEAKAVIDDMIAESDWKKFGYSAVLGGRFTTGYGDMKMRADQVSAILARDNLGLLKGAMSDKDLAFIQAMSGGINDGTISEAYAKQRMESIQEKIQNKLGEVENTGGNITIGDDGQEYEIVD